MCEHVEQDRTSFLACGAVHIAHESQPQAEVAVRPTPDMVRITRGHDEARIHAHEKKILTGDRDVSHHSTQQKIGAPYDPRIDAVAIGSTRRRRCRAMP